MRVHKWTWFAVLFSTVAAGADDGVTQRVERVLNADGYLSARWGVLVVDAKSDVVLLERNADQLFRPASVTKLFSTAAALVELGADFRFETPVVRHGEVDKDGVLRGDLILLARGDLSLGGRTDANGSLLFENNDHSYAGPMSRATIVKADPLAGLDHLAREVAASGIKEVTGEVIVDDRYFEHARATGSGPGQVTPILVNDNVIDVIVTPAESAAAPASVRTVPAFPFATFDAQVDTIEAKGQRHIVVREVGPRRFEVRGRIPVGADPSCHIYEVESPAEFARAAFIEVLRTRGVRVRATSLAGNPGDQLPPRDEVAKLPRVAQYVSPPFREYSRVILKVSQNLHASTLPLLLAAHRQKRTLDAGLEIEGEILKGLGVDVRTISFGGGAGGSPADLVTPRATVGLLKAMAKRPDLDAYLEALPVLGRDGTLASSVLPDSPARGHVRAKTGTYYVNDGLTGKTMLTSKALAGYMETASGRNLIFAVFLNDMPLAVENGDVTEATARAGRQLGKFCEALFADNGEPAAEASTAKPKADAPKGR